MNPQAMLTMLGLIAKQLGEKGLKKWLNDDNLKKWADKGIDMIENPIEKSANTIDDAIFLPPIKQIRKTFNIPDYE